MVIYTREEKVLIIPEGEGCGCQGGGGHPSKNCEREKREAYESGYTEGYNQGQADCPECSGSSCNLQSKSVVVSANTQTVVPDAGYDGMDSVSIDATSFGNGRYQQGYEAGYDSGYEDAEEDYPRIQPQKNYTADTTSFVIVPNNGYDGMGKVNVNAISVFNQGYMSGLTACSGETPCDCSSAITEAYQSGITEGIAQQKSLLGSVTFTHNNTFTNHSGWSSVTVNVPKEVVLGQLVTAPLPSQLQNDRYYIQEFKSGLTVDGWGRVQLDMRQMLYYGQKKQRDLLSATTFTENGVYTRENGWSAVTVDVPQCDCSSAITEAYQSGYTAGSLMDVELYFTTRMLEDEETTMGFYNGRDLTIDGDSYNSTFERLFPQFQIVPYSFSTKVDIHNVTTVSSVTFTVDCNGEESWIIPSIQTFSINGHQVSNMSFSYVETTPSLGSFIKAAIYTITFDEIHI